MVNVDHAQLVKFMTVNFNHVIHVERIRFILLKLIDVNVRLDFSKLLVFVIDVYMVINIMP
jgi:hypothetical protein